MEIAPFETELFYARHEFTAPHLLSASDCETMSVGELLELAGRSLSDFAELRLGYTETRGAPSLRAAIADSYGEAPVGRDVTLDDVLVLGTPVEGIYLTFRALLEPGDRVVVLTPCYDTLLNLARHVAGSVEPWPLQPGEGRWHLDLDRLDELLSESTRLVVVNFPHNPTGFLPEVDELERLVERTAEAGAWLYCDEIYRGLELGGRAPLPSAAELSERAVVLGGLSKAFGLPGLRSGWLVTRSQPARDAIEGWKHYTSICAPAPTEWLAEVALSVRHELVGRGRSIVERNLRAAAPFFERSRDQLVWRPPQAGTVALVETRERDVRSYCESLASEWGVVLLPGPFMHSDEGFVRFGLGRCDFPLALGRYEESLQKS